MEILLLLTALLALFWLVVSVMFLRLSWTTLTVHRQAMHALHQKLVRQALAEQQARQARIVSEESGIDPTVGTGGQW
jgi:hypothetical protein